MLQKLGTSTNHVFSPLQGRDCTNIKIFYIQKRAGDDGFSMNLLKRLGESCSVPTAIIVNMSLEHGIVPDARTQSRFIPIIKQKISNYRPISLLSHIYKVLERVVHKWPYSFLVQYGIIYGRQYGFRQGRSTVDATLLSHIYKVLERVVHKRPYSFLVQYGIIYGRQYGRQCLSWPLQGIGHH